MGGGTDIAALRSQLAARAERLTVELLGEPTARGARYWRWGSRGSLSYDFERHLWHSFEADQGGDLLDLIQFGNPGWDLRQAIIGARDYWAHQPAGRPCGAATARHLKMVGRGWRCGSGGGPSARNGVETYLRGRGSACPNAATKSCASIPACLRGEHVFRRCSA